MHLCSVFLRATADCDAVLYMIQVGITTAIAAHVFEFVIYMLVQTDFTPALLCLCG